MEQFADQSDLQSSLKPYSVEGMIYFQGRKGPCRDLSLGDCTDRQGFSNGLARSCRWDKGLLRLCYERSLEKELVSSAEPSSNTDPFVRLSCAIGRLESAPAILEKENVAHMRFDRCKK